MIQSITISFILKFIVGLCDVSLRETSTFLHTFRFSNLRKQNTNQRVALPIANLEEEGSRDLSWRQVVDTLRVSLWSHQANSPDKTPLRHLTTTLPHWVLKTKEPAAAEETTHLWISAQVQKERISRCWHFAWPSADSCHQGSRNWWKLL